MFEVLCDVRCVMRGVRCAVCGVRCAMCDVRCAMCGVRCGTACDDQIKSPNIYDDSSPSLFSSSGTSAQIEAAKVVAETFLGRTVP